jgi:hypothetical protein
MAPSWEQCSAAGGHQGKRSDVDHWIMVKRIGLDQGIGGVWTVDSTSNAWDLVAHTGWISEICAFRS